MCPLINIIERTAVDLQVVHSRLQILFSYQRFCGRRDSYFEIYSCYIFNLLLLLFLHGSSLCGESTRE